MSYILDALKKSDEERQTHQGPTLQTIQRQSRGPRSNQSLVLVAVICVSVTVILALLGYLWLMRADQALIQPSQSAPLASVSNSASGADNKVEEPVISEGTAESTTSLATTDTATTNTATTDSQASVEPQTPTVAFSELPDNIRNEIPPLTFSFHVYSEKVPANRSIIINKRLSKEGDNIERHLKLIEITQEGVVLQWRQRKFFINVVENW